MNRNDKLYAILRTLHIFHGKSLCMYISVDALCIFYGIAIDFLKKCFTFCLEHVCPQRATVDQGPNEFVPVQMLNAPVNSSH